MVLTGVSKKTGFLAGAKTLAAKIYCGDSYGSGTLLAACAEMSGVAPGNWVVTASQQITLASQIANESQPKVKFFGTRLPLSELQR
jgi:hypothetical protein